MAGGLDNLLEMRHVAESGEPMKGELRCSRVRRRYKLSSEAPATLLPSYASGVNSRNRRDAPVEGGVAQASKGTTQ